MLIEDAIKHMRRGGVCKVRSLKYRIFEGELERWDFIIHRWKMVEFNHSLFYENWEQI